MSDLHPHRLHPSGFEVSLQVSRWKYWTRRLRISCNAGIRPAAEWGCVNVPQQASPSARSTGGHEAQGSSSSQNGESQSDPWRRREKSCMSGL